MTEADTYEFSIVDDATDDDGIIVAQSLPALSGNGTTDIHCGGCGEVLAHNLTVAAICGMFAPEGRLIIRCTCAADNVVPCSRTKADDKAAN